MDAPAEPEGFVALRRRRFVAMVRGLLVLVSISVPMPALGFVDAFWLPLGLIGALAAVALAYAAALWAAARARWGLAQNLVFLVWITFPAVLAIQYDSTGTRLGQVVVLITATLAVSVVQNAMLALSAPEQVRKWQIASFAVFGLGLTALVLRSGLGAVDALTVYSICLLLSAASAWPVHTMVRDLERALVEARRAQVEAEAASTAKSRFLAHMSHELRTPLNAIVGYVELVQEEEPGVPLHEVLPDLERVRGSGVHLLGLVEAILDLAKIESGRVEVDCAPVDVAGLVREVVDALAPLGRKRDLVVCADVGDGPRIVATDRGKLRQILTNLVGNAVKYTEQGSVEVRVACEGADQVIEVRDTGAGISDGALRSVFEAFERSDAPITKQVGGTGLGLTLCRHLCGLIGAELAVSSEVGVGSCFSVRFRDVGVEPEDRAA